MWDQTTTHHIIDTFCKDIIECWINAGVNTITSSKSHKHLVPGWNDLVKPEREHLLFWHQIWFECGKPNRGYVYDIMKRTWARYHYAIRVAKRDEYEIRKQNFTMNRCGHAHM